MTPSAPSVAISPSIAVDVLAELIGTVAQEFPAVGLQAGPADVQTTLDELLPGPESSVVVVAATSGPARDLFVIVEPSLLTAMGASGLDSLTATVEPVLTALADGDTIDTDAARVGSGVEALDGVPVPDGATVVVMAAGLFAGADHVATIGVALHPRGDDDVAAEANDAVDMDLPAMTPTPRAQPAAAPGSRGLDLLGAVEMNVVAELGRTKMTVAELLTLSPGSVVELDRTAGSPIDLLVNGTLIARGEVVVVDEEFGLRISEIVDAAEPR